MVGLGGVRGALVLSPLRSLIDIATSYKRTHGSAKRHRPLGMLRSVMFRAPTGVRGKVERSAAIAECGFHFVYAADRPTERRQHRNRIGAGNHTGVVRPGVHRIIAQFGEMACAAFGSAAEDARRIEQTL